MIAPFDLSIDLGVRLDAPELVEAITLAERVILEAGVPRWSGVDERGNAGGCEEGIPPALAQLRCADLEAVCPPKRRSGGLRDRCEFWSVRRRRTAEQHDRADRKSSARR